MSQGWISLHRKIKEHWLYQEKRVFSKFEAWVDILLLVNHDDKEVLLGSELIIVKRGERITSEYILAERWSWSRTKVRNFLKLLEKDGMIVNQKEDKKRTRLRVLNYNDYQGGESYEKTTEKLVKNYGKTTEELQKNLNNNDNNSLVHSIYKDDFPKFHEWKEEYKNCNFENEQAYYLKYLDERVAFYKNKYGTDNPLTKNEQRTLRERKLTVDDVVMNEYRKIV